MCVKTRLGVHNRSGSAPGHASRITIAQVTYLYQVGLRVQFNHPKRTGLQAFCTADTLFLVQEYRSGYRVTVKCVGRAGLQARRPAAQAADVWVIETQMLDLGDPDARRSGAKVPIVMHNAGHFTSPAATA